MKNLYEKAKKQFIEFCEERDYQQYGYEDPEDFLENIQPEGGYENTLWEQGYLQGITTANNDIENIINRTRGLQTDYFKSDEGDNIALFNISRIEFEKEYYELCKDWESGGDGFYDILENRLSKEGKYFIIL